MSRHETRILLSLAAVYLARMLGLFLLFPIWALFLDDYDFPFYWVAASVIGIYGLTQALMQIPMGLLSDRIGRKPALMIGLALLAIGGIIPALIDSAAAVVAGRLIQGCGATSAVAMALIADEISPPHRLKATAIVGVVIGASFALAMLLSPVLAGLYSGLPAVFALSAALAMVAALAATALPSATKTAAAAPLPASPGMSPAEKSLCFGIFLIHASLSAVFLRVPLMLDHYGVATTYQGWCYLGALVLVAPLLALRLRSMRASAASAPSGLPIEAVALLSLSWMMLSLILPDDLADPSTALLVWSALSLVGYFYGFTLLESALPAAFMSMAGKGQRGLRLGIFSACQFFGSFAGGLAVGLAGIETSLSRAPVLGGFIVLAWFAIHLRLGLVQGVSAAPESVPESQESP